MENEGVTFQQYGNLIVIELNEEWKNLIQKEIPELPGNFKIESILLSGKDDYLYVIDLSSNEVELSQLLEKILDKIQKCLEEE